MYVKNKGIVVNKILFFGFVFCLQAINLQSDWIFFEMRNLSDLVFDKAYRIKDNGKKSPSFVDKKIKNFSGHHPVLIDFMVPTQAGLQGYLCITLRNEKKELFELIFDSQRKHTVTSGRLKSKHVVGDLPLSDDLQADDYTSIARVILKKDGKIISFAQKSYDDTDKNSKFNVLLQPRIDGYFLELEEPAE